jgi:hypothetical protein
VPAQSCLRLSALAAALLLASCATNAPPPPKPSANGAPVDMGLAAEAGAFESFTRKAAAIPADFAGPADIAQGLQAGAAYEPRQLEAGMIAYAALAALQEPAFVAGVRKTGGRDLARRLAANPEAALDLPGGAAAAGRANAALARRGEALARRGEALAQAGRRVKAASYSVQKQGWSKARLTNGPARLALVKRISTAGYRATGDDRARLTAAIAEGGRRGGPSPVVARGVALAALTVMGQEGQGRALTSEPRSAMCLRLAKLNFHQCLASAGTHYEDIYCLGVHAMTDPGQCVVEATKPARIRRAAAD